MSVLTDILASREQSRRNLETLFEENARIRHGIPKGQKEPFDRRAVAPGYERPVKDSPIKDSSAPVRSDPWWKSLLKIALPAALGAGGLSAYNYFNSVDVAPQPPPQVETPGSLYQYLEDHNFHLESRQ